LDGGFVFPITEQIEDYKKILAEGVERLKAMGFSPTARLGIGEAGHEIAKVAKDIGANLVVVGHRPTDHWHDGGSARSEHTWSKIFSAACLISANRNWRRRVCSAADGGCRGGIVIGHDYWVELENRKVLFRRELRQFRLLL